MIKRKTITNLNHNLIIKDLIIKHQLHKTKILGIHIQDNNRNTQIFLLVINFLKINNIKIKILFHKNLSIKIRTNLMRNKVNK